MPGHESQIYHSMTPGRCLTLQELYLLYSIICSIDRIAPLKVVVGLGRELAQLVKSLVCKRDPCEVPRGGLKLAGQPAGLASSLFRERPCLNKVG